MPTGAQANTICSVFPLFWHALCRTAGIATIRAFFLALGALEWE